MKKNAYLIPAVIAFISQLLVVSLDTIVTVLQNQIIPLFFSSVVARGKMVIPFSLVSAGIMSLFYLIYLVIVIFYSGSHRRIIAGVFLALTLLTILLCSGGSTIYSMLFARHAVSLFGGVDALQSAKLSSVNTMISVVSLLPGLFTTSMYYISLGRFGMSDPE